MLISDIERLDQVFQTEVNKMQNKIDQQFRQEKPKEIVMQHQQPYYNAYKPPQRIQRAYTFERQTKGELVNKYKLYKARSNPIDYNKELSYRPSQPTYSDINTLKQEKDSMLPTETKFVKIDNTLDKNIRNHTKKESIMYKLKEIKETESIIKDKVEEKKDPMTLKPEPLKTQINEAINMSIESIEEELHNESVSQICDDSSISSTSSIEEKIF